MFCLSGQAVEEFKTRLRSGEITPEKLAEMDSAQRHGYFASFLGEINAKQVNALSECGLYPTVSVNVPIFNQTLPKLVCTSNYF